MSMMQRLENLLKSYLNFDDSRTDAFTSYDDDFHRNTDMQEAYEELDAFLRGGAARTGGEAARDWEEPRRHEAKPEPDAPPQNLRKDFAELGVAFGADEETCKTAYKKLLKRYHPDRHAEDAEHQKEATRKMTSINVAYDRIRAWRKTASL
jgi:DnaJ-domain-containing protein 1